MKVAALFRGADIRVCRVGIRADVWATHPVRPPWQSQRSNLTLETAVVPVKLRNFGAFSAFTNS